MKTYVLLTREQSGWRRRLIFNAEDENRAKAWADEYAVLKGSSTNDVGIEEFRGAHIEGAGSPADVIRKSEPRGRKLPTFEQARKSLFEYLASKRWRLKTDLKVPHATSPDERIRVWFKPQAVYMGSTDSPAYYMPEFKHARSLWIDIRDMDGPSFVQEVEHSAR